MDVLLDEIETRVLGCLLEKERTTPDAYPLTLNALQMACNQKSSRSPVLSLTTSQIESALDSMRYEKHLVYQVSQAGSRVPKYKHNIEKIGTFSEADIAIIGVLMLRGPQTAGETKTHCERMHHFASREDAEEAIEELRVAESGPFVCLLPREPGRRDRRYMHLLSGAPTESSLAETEDHDGAPCSHTSEPPYVTATERIDTLEQQVATLTTELNRIKVALGLTDENTDETPAPPTETPCDSLATQEQI